MQVSVKVEAGDTLSHIALKLRGRANDWPLLARINRLKNPHLIFPGQTIVVPV